MSYEENRALLKVWLDEVCPYGKEPDRFFRFGGDEESSEVAEARGTVIFCTGVHSYHLSFTDTYLGCTASCRTKRPGESWTRGSDLPDGGFMRATFERIIRRIVEYELVELAPPVVHETVTASGVMAEGPSLPGA